MDFVKVTYTAKVKDGDIFDTTDEKVAKDNNIFDEKRTYKPMPIIIGGKQVVEGLDDGLKGMKAGDKKKVEVTPDKGFGKKDPSLVRLVPMKVFKQQKMTPVPGMPIELDGRPARIQTVAGGRVRVDFNHELAGKILIYDIKVEEKAKTDPEKINYLVERNFDKADDFSVKLTGKELTVVLPEEAYKDRNLLVKKASLAADIYKFLPVEEIIFTEHWKKPKEK